MITIATLLWSPNENSFNFSRMYDETWAEKLYRGFARNLTLPFRFVCFTDRDRTFAEPIQQERIRGRLDYSACIEPYRLGEPMILVGLDTVVTGNVDHLAAYCLDGSRLAVPRDPYRPSVVCNGVALVPGGHERIALDHDGRTNDMDWIRRFNPAVLDDMFGKQVASYKGWVEKHGLGDTRICYFHGERKPHELSSVPWIQKHWR